MLRKTATLQIMHLVVLPVIFMGGKHNSELLQNTTVYFPPLLICSLTQVHVSANHTATYMSVTLTHIFQHPLAPILNLHQLQWDFGLYNVLDGNLQARAKKMKK